MAFYTVDYAKTELVCQDNLNTVCCATTNLHLTDPDSFFPWRSVLECRTSIGNLEYNKCGMFQPYLHF